MFHSELKRLEEIPVDKDALILTDDFNPGEFLMTKAVEKWRESELEYYGNSILANWQAKIVSFSNPIRKKITNSTNTRNPEEISLRNIHAVQLNSQANIKNWQKRLSAEEIDRIYQLTRDVAPLYYSEEDWQ